MKIKEIDLASRVEHLMIEIKHLVEHYDLPKNVIIEDFTDIIKCEFLRNHESR